MLSGMRSHNNKDIWRRHLLERTLRQFRKTALPSGSIYDRTCILVGNSPISFLAFRCWTISSGTQSTPMLHIISFTPVLMRIYSLCSNWDCCQFMDPWSNRITRFPIGGLVFCSNLPLTGKLTKITALMTHNQSWPYEELIGWYFIWEIPLQCRANTPGIQYAPFISSFQKTFKPCL